YQKYQHCFRLLASPKKSDQPLVAPFLLDLSHVFFFGFLASDCESEEPNDDVGYNDESGKSAHVYLRDWSATQCKRDHYKKPDIPQNNHDSAECDAKVHCCVLQGRDD